MNAHVFYCKQPLKQCFPNFIHNLPYTRRLETLKRHLPVSLPERLGELVRIAVRFEENIYTSAPSKVNLTSLLYLSAENKLLVMGAKQGLWANKNRAKLSPCSSFTFLLRGLRCRFFLSCCQHFMYMLFWEHILVFSYLQLFLYIWCRGLNWVWVCEHPHSTIWSTSQLF